MRTRSQSHNSNRQQQQVPPTFVEPFNLVEPIENQAPPVVTMADNRTMAQLLEAPTEGYEDAIVVPEITADNFELKHGLLTLVQNKQFFGHEKEDPHAHIRYFNKITSTMKFPNVPSTSVKLMLFLFSLEGAARIWLEKEPPRSILTWDDLDRHGLSELHQLDTFYNALNSNDQDSLNSAAGGNFLDKMPRDCLRIKSKVHNSRNKSVVSKVSTSNSTPGISPDVAELKDMVKALTFDKENNPSLAYRKSGQGKCVTCGGAHSYRNCPATDDNVYRDNIQEYVSQAAAANFNQGNTGSGTLPSNTITNPKVDLKGITTRSGVAYQGPTIHYPLTLSPPTRSTLTLNASQPNPDPSIPYPSRINDQKIHEKANNQIEKFYQIFQDLYFNISFADALILMPKFASTLKSLISNKEKLFELARTPLNEHCSAVPLKKFPEKLRDPGKFLIPCDFPRMDECLALADLGASINLMPLSVWKKLSLPELTPTCMTLELADRSISQPIGIAEDVYVKVGKFQFLADFVVVDFDADPRVPLILGRSFLKTERALIDVYAGELTLRVGKEAIIFNLDQTLRYSSNYDNSVNRIDVIEMACKEYSQEVIGFSVDSDFILEEVDAFLALEDDPTSSKFCEAKNDKSSIDEPPEVELKDLPPHLEYAFLEGDDKLPVIIAKDLSVEEKAAP
ncbi:reverse transcriptase domain-containing protein [Tanacetum coccineum]